MKTETARTINAALCRAWFSLHVFREQPEQADIELLAGVTLAQAQTATEVIEAMDAAQLAGVGKKRLNLKIAPGTLPWFLEHLHRVAAEGRES